MKHIHAQESGRSMIEMLGVLAIIGVLSVGGIAGYSQAMSKFKVTKTTDQIQTMVTNIRTLFSTQKDYRDVNSASKAAILYSVGILTDEMCSDGSTCTHPTNPYAGTISLQPTANNRSFKIKYGGLTADACVRLATQDWGDASSGLVSILAAGGADVTKTTADGELPMSLSDASTGCGTSGSDSTLVFEYK